LVTLVQPVALVKPTLSLDIPYLRPYMTIIPNSALMVPATNERLNEIKDTQEDAKAMLEITNENMKHFYNKEVQDAPKFKIEDLV